jgi:enoyl-CoA hydratase/carnithine racemase
MLDIRIGCENTEIQFLAAKYGRANSTWSLPLVVGMPKAKELLYTGRPVRAEEAERIGLLNQVVHSSQLLDAAIAMAKQIGENDPRMVQGIKKLLDDGVGTLWRERFDAEQNARKNKLKANSPREGFKAFLERKGIRRCHYYYRHSGESRNPGVPANQRQRWILAGVYPERSQGRYDG